MAESGREQIDALFKCANDAAKVIEEHAKAGDFICAISHLDADGIAAAGIVGQLLTRLEAHFRLQIAKQIDETLIEELAKEDARLYIFTDLGSGYLDQMGNYFTKSDVVTLDHHQPVGKVFSRLSHVNPHLQGFDGASEISGAGVAYLTARGLNEKNVDLAVLAVIGALGDMQDRNKQRALQGLNDLIVKDAVSADYLKVETDLILYGRETRPISQALSHTTNPFIPGLSGEEDRCLGFLVNLGIDLKSDDRWRTLTDLTTDEKQKLFSELVKYLISKEASSDIALSLVGAVYTLTNEDRGTPLRDAREYASLLNACGRMGKGGLGVSICMGDRGKAFEEAQGVLSEYRKTLAKYMDWLAGPPRRIQETEVLYVIRGEGVIDEKLLGAVSSMLTGLFKPDKPIIAFTTTEKGDIKVSARGTDLLIARGLNLGLILQRAAEEVSGKGGGHNIAAGAQIPKDHLEDFLKYVSMLVREVVARES